MTRKVIVTAAIASVLAAAALGRSEDRKLDNSRLRAAGQGRAVYLANCAGCHGVDAHGGYSATTDNSAPDLTLIAVRDGRFDGAHVALHIDGRRLGPRADMPAWGRVFGRGGNDSWAMTRVYVLTRYLDFIQAPEGLD